MHSFFEHLNVGEFHEEIKNKELNILNKRLKNTMKWILNDNQNIDESINTPNLDSNFYLFIGQRFIPQHYTVVFFGNSVQKMCTSAPYHITTKTRILGAQV